MAKHKAATDVTIAPLEERSTLEQVLFKYWFHAAVLALLATGWILYSQYSAGQQQAVRASSWETMGQKTTMGGFPPVPTAPAVVLSGLADELNGTAAGPWARLLEATTLLNEKKFAEAAAAAGRLREDYPEHALVQDKHDFGDDRPPRTLIDNLLESIDRQQNWEASHTELFSNPPPPTGAQQVRLKTDRGEVLVALYSDLAPKHVENFLTRCGEGYYDGTRFHRVQPGMMIQGGDPNSKEDDVTTWGLGGPEEKVPFEENDLYHFEGVLSAAKKPGEKDSSGSQFFITTGNAHHLDGVHVIFGAVLEGMDVLQTIAGGAVVEGTDRPSEPVVLQGTEVL